MIRSLTFALLITASLLSSWGFAEQPALTKAQELSQAVDFVSRLSASQSKDRRPSVGLLSSWELRFNTYAEDRDQQLERSSLYPLYYECCGKMEKLYPSRLSTYLKEDAIGYPSQVTIVDFDDENHGRSHLVVGLWEGNDSTGFYFLHLPGSYELSDVWKKRESWSLEGNFFDAKKPPSQAGGGKPAASPESK